MGRSVAKCGKVWQSAKGKVAKDGKVGHSVAKLVRSGLKWFKVVRSGLKWFEVV